MYPSLCRRYVRMCERLSLYFRRPLVVMGAWSPHSESIFRHTFLRHWRMDTGQYAIFQMPIQARILYQWAQVMVHQMVLAKLLLRIGSIRRSYCYKYKVICESVRFGM